MDPGWRSPVSLLLLMLGEVPALTRNPNTRRTRKDENIFKLHKYLVMARLEEAMIDITAIKW